MLRHILRLGALIALLITLVSTSQAGLYRWTDNAGTVHFSDTLPETTVVQEGLDPVDPAERPLLPKPLLLFKDPVFEVRLLAEEDDSLQFEVRTNEIHRTFPELIRQQGRLDICALSPQVTSYIEYTITPVEGGSATLTLKNRMSRHSPSRLQTDSLRLSLYLHNAQGKGFTTLFRTDIPLRKIWEKRSESSYR